jgi:hypothetical protein
MIDVHFADLLQHGLERRKVPVDVVESRDAPGRFHGDGWFPDENIRTERGPDVRILL